MLLSRLESGLHCWLASVTVMILQLSSCSEASGAWKDAMPKLVSLDSYPNFRSFKGSHFGSMTFSESQRMIMVGARNSFYLMDLNHPLGSSEGIRNYTWNLNDQTISICLMKGVPHWKCQNFIEVLQPNPAKNNSLLICGTNAQAPLCREFTDSSLTQYQEFDGTFICPFNPNQEGTAIFADGSLYTGAVRDNDARDSVIFKKSPAPDDTFLTTKAMDAMWLKIPNFVKSFDVGDWVMFFFREVAVEYSSGDAIYSRVAKVCKNDRGGTFISETQWTTFQKIRLNCSFPGAFPFYFNYLQDVDMVVMENDTLFYGIFTTGSHEIPGSAVCVFSLNTIETIMNEGEFKEQLGGKWYPASPPENVIRPGGCDLDSKALQSSSLQWITLHPLMHESVPNHRNPEPVFDLTRADFRLTQIVVDEQQAEDGDYHVLFLGSDDSRLLKVVLVPTEGGGVRANLLEEVMLHPADSSERVVNMEMVHNHEGKNVLIINTNSSILEVPLSRCSNFTSECGCIQDPYCAWNSLSSECYIFTGENSYDGQDVSNILECPEEAPLSATPQPECVCETLPPVDATSTRYTTTSTTTTVATTPTTVDTTLSTTTGHMETDRSTAGIESPSTTEDNTPTEGKNTLSLPPSTTSVDPHPGGLLEGSNVLVLVFLILGWILFTFCGMVVLYQCYSHRHKGLKAKDQKDILCSSPSPNGKVVNGTLQEVPWLPPCRTSHTPAGREARDRDSLGPVNGHSLPRRPMPVPTPTVPSSYRSPPPSFAHTVGSLPSPARINKYMNSKSHFNSLDRHRTPAIHNLYVEHPRAYAQEPYSPPPYLNGRIMTAEDRRPSGASDSEMYDDDVWQPRMEGEELV